MKRTSLGKAGGGGAVCPKKAGLITETLYFHEIFFQLPGIRVQEAVESQEVEQSLVQAEMTGSPHW